MICPRCHSDSDFVSHIQFACEAMADLCTACENEIIGLLESSSQQHAISGIDAQLLVLKLSAIAGVAPANPYLVEQLLTERVALITSLRKLALEYLRPD